MNLHKYLASESKEADIFQWLYKQILIALETIFYCTKILIMSNDINDNFITLRTV